jgi:hypothetical protein
VLNPQVVVFGGDLTEAVEPLLAGVRELVYRRANVRATRQLQIEQSELGQGAGIAGCAEMTLAEVLSPHAIDAALIPKQFTGDDHHRGIHRLARRDPADAPGRPGLRFRVSMGWMHALGSIGRGQERLTGTSREGPRPLLLLRA